VLSCVDDLGRPVAETARALEPSGRFCLSIPHPLHTAAGKYVDEHRHSETVHGVEFVNVHRPLETYARALASAGFAIEDLREPRPAFLQLRAMHVRS
jgi:hypothetical protein